MTIRKKIEDGPPKYDWSLALFYGDSHNRLSVMFLIADEDRTRGHSFPFIINEVGREDGGGNSWTFKGWGADGDRVTVQGCYNTRTRKGWIEVIG